MKYLARFDSIYWRLKRQAERQEHYKGKYKAKKRLYGKGSEAEFVRLTGRD